MARRTRQISLKECYEILKLQKGADLAAVKSAYRRRAFELHPDLHPGDAEAARQFQKLNEAYVALSAMLKPAEEARQRAEARKSQTASQGAETKNGPEAKTGAQQQADARKEQASQAYAEQDVLRDLLNDPFARRVFEDIYSELARKQESQAPPQKDIPKQEKKPESPPPRPETKVAPPRRAPQPRPTVEEKGVMGAIKGLLRKQLDDEQSLTLPAADLVPGRKVRLHIRPGMSEDLTAVDITLPPDFVVGKPLRLRGLGRKLGSWQGDLYLTIYSR